MQEVSVATLDGRVTVLERTVPSGLQRIEELILREIHDLKNEQIKNIEKAIERIEVDTKAALGRIEDGIKRDIDRIADDQRRLWEHVGALELRDSARTGSSRTVDRMWNFVSAISGALLVILSQLAHTMMAVH